MSSEIGSPARPALIEAITREIRRSQNRSDAYDESVCEALGINRTDGRCLDILEQDGPLTAGRLAELAGLTTGAMTTVLDRLERAGYARRVRDADDRRRVQVELTPEARRAFGPYYEPMVALSDELYSRYSDDQLRVVLDFLQTGALLFERALPRLQGELAWGAHPPR
jgi:DNA-binding MarR family transcriptional regulator